MSASVRRRPSPTVPSPSSRTARDSSPASGALEVTATSAPSQRKAARKSRLLPGSRSQTSNNTPIDAYMRPPAPPRRGLSSLPLAEARAQSAALALWTAHPGPRGLFAGSQLAVPRGSPAPLPRHALTPARARCLPRILPLPFFSLRRPLIHPDWTPSPSKAVRVLGAFSYPCCADTSVSFPI